MEVQNQLIERRIYSLDLQQKICKEHIDDGAKLADLVNIIYCIVVRTIHFLVKHN